ncbi:hypothetical protein V8E51_015452 [Hyaloscypha variabilis]
MESPLASKLVCTSRSSNLPFVETRHSDERAVTHTHTIRPPDPGAVETRICFVFFLYFFLLKTRFWKRGYEGKRYFFASILVCSCWAWWLGKKGR